jgi:hypothetical protein
MSDDDRGETRPPVTTVRLGADLHKRLTDLARDWYGRPWSAHALMLKYIEAGVAADEKRREEGDRP